MSSVEVLSFVRRRPRSEWTSMQLSPLCFWDVHPTGNYTVDCRMGTKLAVEFLEYQGAHRDSGVLQHVVSDMPRELTGIEVAFLEMISFASSEGVHRAKRISSHWDASEQAA